MGAGLGRVVVGEFAEVGVGLLVVGVDIPADIGFFLVGVCRAEIAGGANSTELSSPMLI